ncbi:DinB family protein [Halalkalibacter nanhaiisediminis]|uniref:DinB family protein n=1 Tax=Halalkalibacter nanhaiisediminis TaxID=688079 RepID=A0A562QP85_9BACI|nr:DinB family protein [Halalkalibacter nanhaiisediminis]TWI58010.1 DinB family protein [Halalkalibacter nanhaiisediminis]
MTYSPFAFARSANMQILAAAKETQVDTIPDGFNNSLRWNAGHVLVIAESVLRHSDHYEQVIPSHYETFFHKGTSPADWTDEPPTVEEIAELSSKQLASAKNLFENHADAPIAKAFELRGEAFSTVPDLISFLSFHEGLHCNTMRMQYKKTKA